MDMDLAGYARGYTDTLRWPFLGIGVVKTAASGALRRLVRRSPPVRRPAGADAA